MNQETWLGLALVAAYLSFGYLRIKRSRRSGVTHSFGQPALDSFLLLLSGILLASTLLFISFESHRRLSRVFVYPLLLGAGGVLTWVCSGVLRRTQKPRNY